MSRHVPLFVHLAHVAWPQDVEPVIRQALVEQIPHIAAYLFQARTVSSPAHSAQAVGVTNPNHVTHKRACACACVSHRRGRRPLSTRSCRRSCPSSPTLPEMSTRRCVWCVCVCVAACVPCSSSCRACGRTGAAVVDRVGGEHCERPGQATAGRASAAVGAHLPHHHHPRQGHHPGGVPRGGRAGAHLRSHS
jgi:hypothetical protein